MIKKKNWIFGKWPLNNLRTRECYYCYLILEKTSEPSFTWFHYPRIASPRPTPRYPNPQWSTPHHSYGVGRRGRDERKRAVGSGWGARGKLCWYFFPRPQPGNRCRTTSCGRGWGDRRKRRRVSTYPCISECSPSAWIRPTRYTRLAHAHLAHMCKGL